VSTGTYLAELLSLVDKIDAVNANAVPLTDVEDVWAGADAPSERTVLVP
jgi:hypothetical protein